MTETYRDETCVVHHGCCLDVLRAMPDKSVDLCFTSPPYEAARLYSELQFKLKGQAWVDWCVPRFLECLRVTRGIVCWVVEGQTRQFRWSATPALLMADLHRAGVHLRKPPVFHRVGIPGSGGPDWLRNDYEFAICAGPGGKLPWSDNTAAGHPPKWAPGGAMSHRLSDGTRRNQWGHSGTGKHAERRVNEDQGDAVRPSHLFTTKVEAGVKVQTMREPDGTMREQAYLPPVLANPGNVFRGEKLGLQSLNIIDILETYEQLTKKDSTEILRDLREAVASKGLPQWLARVYCGIQEAAILQSHLSRSSDLATRGAEARRPAASREEDCAAQEDSGHLREVRTEESSGGAPQRWGRDEQRDRELGGPVPVVPQAGAQDRIVLDSRLRQGILGPGVLLDALPEIQEAWRSIGEAAESTLSTAESSNLIRCVVGGGHMGSDISRLNEAPFPLALADIFVRSFCPPGGIALDPFCGSGTVAQAAILTGRGFVGIDIRESQCDLTRRRILEARGQLVS